MKCINFSTFYQYCFFKVGLRAGCLFGPHVVSAIVERCLRYRLYLLATRGAHYCFYLTCSQVLVKMWIIYSNVCQSNLGTRPWNLLDGVTCISWIVLRQLEVMTPSGPLKQRLILFACILSSDLPYSFWQPAHCLVLPWCFLGCLLVVSVACRLSSIRSLCNRRYEEPGKIMGFSNAMFKAWKSHKVLFCMVAQGFGEAMRLQRTRLHWLCYHKTLFCRPGVTSAVRSASSLLRCESQH